MPVNITDLNFDITTLITDYLKFILDSEKVPRASQIRTMSNLALSIPSPCWLQSIRKHFWMDGCFIIPGEPKGHLEEMKRLLLPRSHSTMLLAASHIRELKYTYTDAIRRYRNRNEIEKPYGTGCRSPELDCPPTAFLEWCASTYPGDDGVTNTVTVAQRLFPAVVKLTIEGIYMLDDRVPPGADLSTSLQKHQKAHSLTSKARISLITSFPKLSILSLSRVKFSSPEQLYELLRELKGLREVELVAPSMRKDNKRVYEAGDELPLPSPPLGLLSLERVHISDLDFAGGFLRSFYSCPNIRKIEVTKSLDSDNALFTSLNGLSSSYRELESIVLLRIREHHPQDNGQHPVLVDLLLNCPKLRHVSLGLESITAAMLISLLTLPQSEPSLLTSLEIPKLQEIVMKGVADGMLSLDRLLQASYNRLQSLTFFITITRHEQSSTPKLMPEYSEAQHGSTEWEEGERQFERFLGVVDMPWCKAQGLLKPRFRVCTTYHRRLFAV